MLKALYVGGFILLLTGYTPALIGQIPDSSGIWRLEQFPSEIENLFMRQDYAVKAELPDFKKAVLHTKYKEVVPDYEGLEVNDRFRNASMIFDQAQIIPDPNPFGFLVTNGKRHVFAHYFKSEAGERSEIIKVAFSLDSLPGEFYLKNEDLFGVNFTVGGLIPYDRLGSAKDSTIGCIRGKQKDARNWQIEISLEKSPIGEMHLKALYPLGNQTVEKDGEQYFVLGDPKIRNAIQPISDLHVLKQNFELDPKDGNWLRYFKDKKEVVANTFKMEDGVLRGEMQSFYPTGALQYSEHFDNGRKDGLMKAFHENGAEMFELKYRKGEVRCFQKFKAYWSNNTLAEEGRLKKGKPHGKWTYYYEDGHIKAKGKYKAVGELSYRTGKWIFYYPDGNFMAEVYYDHNNESKLPLKICIPEGEHWVCKKMDGTETSLAEMQKTYPARRILSYKGIYYQLLVRDQYFD